MRVDFVLCEFLVKDVSCMLVFVVFDLVLSCDVTVVSLFVDTSVII